jgi:hypothetical protein
MPQHGDANTTLMQRDREEATMEKGRAATALIPGRRAHRSTQLNG